MQLPWVFAFWPLLISPAFSQSQEILSRLNQLGLDRFARMLFSDNPELLDRISKRNDITIWAPRNAAVASLVPLRKRGEYEDRLAAAISHTRPDPPYKRQGSPIYPATNFETIYTFLLDPDYVCLGTDNPARFTKNYASSFNQSSTSPPTVDVVTGMGNTQSTLRGPFKFANGVIYEVNNFFTLPQGFKATMKHLKIAKAFYNSVKSCGKLSVFSETCGVTIFAPIDAYGNHTRAAINPEAHILKSLQYSPELLPGTDVDAMSGDSIKITWAPNGDRLVNCRRLVKPNVPIKNGVIHFIDGPLFGSEGCRDYPRAGY